MDEFGISLNLLLLFFPAISIIYPLTGIYVQSRIVGIPFLLKEILVIEKELAVFILPLIISIIVPVVGLAFNRSLSLIDIAYILSFLYLIIFAQKMGKKPAYFVKFLKIFTMSNIAYSIFQVALCNIGMDKLSMIHSNVPMQIAHGYTIPPTYNIPYVYRFSGFFAESSPFVFYLSSVYVFVDAVGVGQYFSVRSRKVILLTSLIMITLSDSKFAYVFLLVLGVDKITSLLKTEYFRFILNFFGSISFVAYTIINYSDIVNSLSYLPSFSDRHSNIENGLIKLQNFFGAGFVSTSSAESELDGALDAISIITSGYGFVCGIIILTVFLIWILRMKPHNLRNFVMVYILGLTSSGSFLVPQYTLLFTMIYVLTKIQSKNNLGLIKTINS